MLTELHSTPRSEKRKLAVSPLAANVLTRVLFTSLLLIEVCQGETESFSSTSTLTGSWIYTLAETTTFQKKRILFSSGVGPLL